MLTRRTRLLLAVLVLAVGVGALARGAAAGSGSDGSQESLSTVDALVLGVVEGITEYLPVSSTGHLVVTERLLDLGNDEEAKTALDAYTVIIQFGAILAVLAVSWPRVVQILHGIFGGDREGRHLTAVLLAVFAPAAVLGLAFSDTIDEHLLSPAPVAGALIVGGIAILMLTPWLRHRSSAAGATLEQLTVRNAFVIGLLQTLALWPGTSRSLVTILGGLVVGLSIVAAVEFSFLLGLVTLTAATVLASLKDGGEVLDRYGVVTPLIGIVAAGIAAFVAVRSFVAFLRKRELTGFGYYRIGFGVLIIVLMATTTRL